MATDTRTTQPSGFLTFLWAISFFAVFALIFGVAVKWSSDGNIVEDKRGNARYAARIAIENDATRDLGTFDWIDKAKGVVRLPIADAKIVVARELAAKKPAPSQIKVEPLPPLFVPDPASKEPPPSPLPNAPGGTDNIQFGSPAAPAAPAPAPAATPAAPAPAKPAPAPAANPQPAPPAK